MKFFSFIAKCVRIILFTKLDFLRPKKSRVLFFDNESSEIPMQYLSRKKTHILYTRKERLNLYVIFFNFLAGKFKALDYFQSYIDYVQPKIIITIIDNNPLFYKLKKNYKQKKIIIASTWRSVVDDYSIFKIENFKVKVIKDKNYNADYIFVINKSIGKLFKKLNIKKIIPLH